MINSKKVNELLTIHLSMSSMLLEASNYFESDEVRQSTIEKSQVEYKKFQKLMEQAINEGVKIAYDIDRSITKKLPKNNHFQILKLIKNAEQEAAVITESLYEKEIIVETTSTFSSFKNYLKGK